MIVLFKSNGQGYIDDYIIADATINSNYLIALGGLFNYIAKPDTISNIHQKNSLVHKTYQEKNFFRKGLPTGISIILLLLLVNVFFFNSYFKHQQELESQVAVSRTQKEQFIEDSNRIQTKQTLVNNILGASNSKASYYMNRMVASAPESIGFDQINFQPLERSIRSDKKIIFEYAVIAVKGISTEKQDFSSWISSLEGMEWIRKVIIVSYSSTTSTSEFDLLIEIE